VPALWKIRGAHASRFLWGGDGAASGMHKRQVNGSQKSFSKFISVAQNGHQEFFILHTSFVIDRVPNREYSHFTLNEYFQPTAPDIPKIFPPPRVDVIEQT
jgi:hypothetical protein